MPEAVLGHVPVHYEVTGVGKPLLMVHGLFSDMRVWRSIISQLSPNFQVISYDLRGHGLTGKGRSQDYSIQLFADDLGLLLDHLNVQKTVLIGHSAGGAIVCQFAATCPGRVSSLVLVGAPSEGPPGLRAGFFFARFLGIPRTLRLNAPKFFYPVTEEKVQAMRADYEKAGKAATLATARALLGYSFPKQLINSSIPTLLIYGDHDGNLGQGREIANYVQGSKLIIVPEAGHWLPLDKPGDLGGLITGFCSAPDPPEQQISGR